MSDKEIITRIYKERSNVEIYYKSTKPSVREQYREGILNNLMLQALSLIDEDGAIFESNKEAAEAYNDNEGQKLADLTDEQKKEFDDNPVKPNKGFNDMDGVYPKIFRAGNKPGPTLATGEEKNTCISYRNENVETKNKLPSGKSWNEPKAQYKTQYGKNYVIATEGGVSMEMDSSDGGKAFRVNHPTNSYIEIGNDGSIITRANNNITEICKVDYSFKVGANYKLSIANARETFIQNSDTTEIMGTRSDRVLMDDTLFIGGTKSETVGISSSETVGADKSLKVLGSFSETIGSSRSTIVAGKYDVTASILNLTGGTVKITGGTIMLN